MKIYVDINGFVQTETIVYTDTPQNYTVATINAGAGLRITNRNFTPSQYELIISAYNSLDSNLSIAPEIGGAFPDVATAYTYLTVTLGMNGAFLDNNVIARYESGEAITAFRAIMISGNKLYHYDTSDVTNVNLFAGISLETTALGELCSVQNTGIVQTGGAYIEKQALFSDAAGVISATESSPISHIIGVATFSDSILIKSYKPVIKL